MALRARIKLLQDSAKAKGKNAFTIFCPCVYIFILKSIFYFPELYYLIYWKETNEVSVHKESEIKEAVDRAVGASCVVSDWRKLYEGVIACTGKLYKLRSGEF